MAWNTKQTGTKHNDLCTMAFGRLSTHSDCPRCQELKDGAAVRKGWNNDKLKQEARNREAMELHFAPGGKHDQITKAGGIDTAFQW